MSDQTDSQVPNEDTNASQAAISQKESGETQSGNSLDTSALDQLLENKDASEYLRRKFQSSNDKAVARIEKEMEELKKSLNSVAPVGEQNKPETQEVTSSMDIVAIKRAYPDIDFNAPEVVNALAQNINNQDAFLLALGKVKVASANKPQPTSASVTPPVGSAKPKQSITDLQAEYESLMSDPRAVTDPKKKARRKEIIAAMEQLEQA